MTTRSFLLVGFATLVAVGMLLLLTTVSALPMQDFPEHLHMASTIASHVAGTGHVASAYTIDLMPGTYVGTFWVWLGLSQVLPVELAGRLLVLGYVLGTSLLTALLIRRIRPDTPYEVALAVGWWVPFSFFYYMGFVPYLMTVPLLLSLAIVVLRLGQKPSDLRLGTGAALTLVALYLAHPFGSALGLLTLTTFLAVGWLTQGSLRGTLGKGVWIAVTVALGCLILVLIETESPVAAALSSSPSQNPYEQSAWLDSLKLFGRIPLGPLVGSAMALQLAAVGLLVAGFAAAWPVGQHRSTDLAKQYRYWLFTMAALVAAGSFWLAARQASGTLYHRLFIFPWILLLISLAIGSRWRPTARWLIVLSSLAHVGAVSIAHWGFHREMVPLRETVQELPDRATLLPLLFDRDSGTIRDEYVHLMQHVGAYHLSSPYLYSPDHDPLPVRPLFSRNGLPALSRPWKFDWNPATEQASHILVRAASAQVRNIPIMKLAYEKCLARVATLRREEVANERWLLFGPFGPEAE